MSLLKKVTAVGVVIALLSLAGAAGATAYRQIVVRGADHSGAVLRCPGGMTRLGHELNGDISVFPGDPAVSVELEYTVVPDGFRVEDIELGSHAGTHLDVPSHFIGGARSIDELAADEFVWPIYKIDVRGRTFEDNFVQKRDIRAYEREHGRIPKGALVVLQTGAEEFWGADELVVDDMGNANNVDDLFDFVNPGFSSEAVQWLFDRRHIDGVGSDAYGPDAATDDGFGATFTALDNDGVALVALANLDRVAATGDIVMAPTVSLSEGSGFATDPIACHGRQRRR